MTIVVTIEIEIEEPAPSTRPLTPGAEKLREHIRAIYSEPCPRHLPARAE